MKKGIECESAYDCAGNWVLRIRKKRGQLTLEEIKEAAMAWEQDYYGLVMRCMDDDMIQYYDDDLQGDAVELYRIEDMLELIGRVRSK